MSTNSKLLQKRARELETTVSKYDLAQIVAVFSDAMQLIKTEAKVMRHDHHQNLDNIFGNAAYALALEKTILEKGKAEQEARA